MVTNSTYNSGLNDFSATANVEYCCFVVVHCVGRGY